MTKALYEPDGRLGESLHLPITDTYKSTYDRHFFLSYLKVVFVKVKMKEPMLALS